MVQRYWQQSQVVATSTPVTVRDEGFIGRSEAAFHSEQKWQLDGLSGTLSLALMPNAFNADVSADKTALQQEFDLTLDFNFDHTTFEPSASITPTDNYEGAAIP